MMACVLEPTKYTAICCLVALQQLTSFAVQITCSARQKILGFRELAETFRLTSLLVSKRINFEMLIFFTFLIFLAFLNI